MSDKDSFLFGRKRQDFHVTEAREPSIGRGLKIERRNTANRREQDGVVQIGIRLETDHWIGRR